MGYDSNFMLSFRKADGTAFNEKDGDVLADELEKQTGYSTAEISSCAGSDRLTIGFYNVHWYDAVTDLDTFMAAHRELELDFTREGEDHDDTEEYAWRDGVRYESGAKEFRPPLLDGKSVCLAWVDGTGCLHVEKTAAENLEKTKERLRDRGYSALKVNSCDLFGDVTLLMPEEGCRDLSLYDGLEHALGLLEAIRKSNRRPFASPSPSSTESRLKRCVASALSCLEEAIECSKALRY